MNMYKPKGKVIQFWLFGETEKDIRHLETTTQWENLMDNSLVPYFIKFMNPENNNIAISSIYVNKPNLQTTAFDRRNQYYIGLHVDNHDKSSQKNTNTRNRLCINLSKSPRYFLFCNLTHVEAKNYELFSKKESLNMSDCNTFRELFFQKFPHYPILRIKINPFQAYLAPTDNIIHDGSSIGSNQLDLSTMALGDLVLNNAFQLNLEKKMVL